MSKQAKGWILLAFNYVLPLICNLLMMSDGLSTISEKEFVISIVVVIAAIPIIYIYINIIISRFLGLASVASAAILFTGMLQFIVTGYFVIIFKDKDFQVDLKTLNIYTTIIAYYLFVSLIYYLVKKDDNVMTQQEENK